MNFINRTGPRVVIRQVPIALLFIAGFFSLPFLAFSFFAIATGSNAEGKYFCLFFGLFLLWVFLEFVATRECIEIDREARVLTRTVSGVFRNPRQIVPLDTITDLSLESRVERTGIGRTIRREYLFLNGREKQFLVNSPAKVYLDHAKLAKLLQEATGLTLRKLRDGKEELQGSERRRTED